MTSQKPLSGLVDPLVLQTSTGSHGKEMAGHRQGRFRRYSRMLESRELTVSGPLHGFAQVLQLRPLELHKHG